MKLLWVVVLLSSVVLAGTHAPLPEKLLHAKSVYIENHASAAIYDRAVDEFRKWGRFQLLTNREGADLILEITADNRAELTTFTFIDPQTGEHVWSDQRFWGRWKSATREMVRDLRKRMG